ncbi:tryptophan 2,3-dioxygenase KynA [Shewanella sp. NFH-SH190041]|uniref:PrnB family protein n=1 Tax=Shewanella sp. NFH-SH190041 TaxID=2950245 RepID=UPI0021C3FE69|nr:monodechloroaminopyrrolnitrin synthase PrnB family protein [Shewanella sp. NFH-SH190041]BDM65937.1 tryptophan 2,3-dioxygenase KynA [Shewanella sp. NFH-SH190041]
MISHSDRFDQWIRDRFVVLNTELERLYAEQADRSRVVGIGDELKQTLLEEGNRLISALLLEGNTDQGFDAAFDLLGNVGLFMAACRRHELTEPFRETVSPLYEASALAMHIGASIGVTPRFATAHLTTHNRAINGVYKRFTSLPAEQLFLDYNTRGILAYKRAADALLKIRPLGLSHPLTADLLSVANDALAQVQCSNAELYQQLNTDDFFYQVRPYYKPYRVGSQIYRGANAGDFAGINVIDMLLGLCPANDPAYSPLLVDKFLYMVPEDQRILRDCMRMNNYLDEFLVLIAQHQTKQPWFAKHLALFLAVCHSHGVTAAQHHEQLVEKYIRQPASALAPEYLDKVTASGPALAQLLSGLEKLKDRRCAAKRDDIATRHDDIVRLQQELERLV